VSFDVPGSIPIPADIDRPDKVLAGLTARQVAILAVAAAIIWALFEVTRRLIPVPVLAVLAAPAGVAAVVLVTGQRDGLTLDRLLAAAWAWRRSPRRLVTAPAPPAWTDLGVEAGQGPLPGVLGPLWPRITGEGVIGLGDGGAAVTALVSTVNLALRSPAEQQALTGAYGRWLNSLTGPAQILVRAGRADLSPVIADLEDSAAGLPHPALEAAALDHAAWLSGLAGDAVLLTRQAILVVREPRRSGPPAGRAGGAGTGARALQRAGEAARLLAGAGLAVAVLDGGQATALLAAAADPAADVRATRLALPGEAVTGPGGWA
jgi:hypothetical protein